MSLLFQAGVVCTRVTGRHDMQQQDAARDQGKHSGRGAQCILGEFMCYEVTTGSEPCIDVYTFMYLP